MTDDTLTLRASGPATATKTEDVDGVAIATTTEVELDAELELTAEWLTEHGYVSERSETRLYPDDVAEVVCEAHAEEATVTPKDGWTLEISGSLDTWQRIAYELADAAVTVNSKSRTARVMCHVLQGLSEHAVDERPRYALLDVLDDYDPKGYSRAAALNELAADADPTPEAGTATPEATADD